ncbi:MAG TPA: protein phosphatase 2C domain-containing protein [Euzebya sp.]|nr:protein phosphatase 2C domain-containing protein [Euzebya sp.]
MDVILRGVDHPDLGTVAALAPAPDLAIALTRGRFAKRYPYTDPNEDVVAASRHDGRTALIVADGHSGHEGSHAAVEHLLHRMDHTVPVWSRVEAVQAFHAVNEHIRQVRGPLAADHRRTRTTLALAVVAQDAAGQRFLTHCAVGDSAVVVVRGEEVHQLTRDRQHFMGDRLTPPLLAGALDYGQVDLAPADVVVVVSDGFTNFAPVHAIARAVTATDVVKAVACHIIDIAGDGGAGDNVAVAVLGPSTTPTDRI